VNHKLPAFTDLFEKEKKVPNLSLVYKASGLYLPKMLLSLE